MPDEQAGRCGGCRHWTAGVDPPWRGGQGFGVCNAVGNAGDRPKAIPLDVLAVLADDADRATLHTRAGFGCVLWEPVTPPAAAPAHPTPPAAG